MDPMRATNTESTTPLHHADIVHRAARMEWAATHTDENAEDDMALRDAIADLLELLTALAEDGPEDGPGWGHSQARLELAESLFGQQHYRRAGALASRAIATAHAIRHSLRTELRASSPTAASPPTASASPSNTSSKSPASRQPPARTYQRAGLGHLPLSDVDDDVRHERFEIARRLARPGPSGASGG